MAYVQDSKGNFTVLTWLDGENNYIWDIRVVPVESGIAGAIFVNPANTITIIGITPSGQTFAGQQIDGLFFSRLQEY